MALTAWQSYDPASLQKLMINAGFGGTFDAPAPAYNPEDPYGSVGTWQGMSDEAKAWLTQQGLTPAGSDVNRTITTGLLDKSGNPVAQSSFNGNRNLFGEFLRNGALLAGGAGLASGLLAGGLSGLGAAAPAGDAATSAAWGSGAGLGGDTLGAMGYGGAAAGGAGAAPYVSALGPGAADFSFMAPSSSLSGLTTSQLAEIGANQTAADLAAGAAGGAAGAALGGTASAPASGGAVVPGGSPGLLGAAGGASSWLKSNPELGKLLFAGAGGLLGAAGGAGGSSGSAPYTGPMPTISRGGWQPQVAAQSAPQTSAASLFGLKPLPTTGTANAGLWRYLNGGQ